MPPHEFAVKCGIFGVVVNLFTLRHFALLLEYCRQAPRAGRQDESCVCESD